MTRSTKRRPPARPAPSSPPFRWRPGAREARWSTSRSSTRATRRPSPSPSPSGRGRRLPRGGDPRQAPTQWNRYAEHAAAAGGGSFTHHKRFGEEGAVYRAVPRSYQLQAMRFPDEHVLSTPTWALKLDVLRRLEHAGAVERIGETLEG